MGSNPESCRLEGGCEFRLSLLHLPPFAMTCCQSEPTLYCSSLKLLSFEPATRQIDSFPRRRPQNRNGSGLYGKGGNTRFEVIHRSFFETTLCPWADNS
jgi:hypothetical protein